MIILLNHIKHSVKKMMRRQMDGKGLGRLGGGLYRVSHLETNQNGPNIDTNQYPKRAKSMVHVIPYQILSDRKLQP